MGRHPPRSAPSHSEVETPPLPSASYRSLKETSERIPASCNALCSPVSSLQSYSIATAAGHRPKGLISLKPPPMAHEHPPPPLIHRDTRSHTSALSCGHPADLGNRGYPSPITTSLPSSFYLPQLNYPYLSPAPWFWLASRLAGPDLALRGGRGAQSNRGFARKRQKSKNHPDMGQHARQGE